MPKHEVVSREQWLAARRELLAEEKAFNKARDALSERRRALPWTLVDKPYSFESSSGRQTLAELFGPRSQLLVYHFMFGPEWEQGCQSCSFWADNFNGIDIHLAHRDISFVVISRAPLEKLETYRQRMGWTFKWVSSFGSDFNFDYNVSFTPEQIASGEMNYNYGLNRFPSSEATGASAFAKDEDGTVYHTYSTYSRGVDMLNGAYHWMDIAPKGRDEKGLPYSMAWLKRHDMYED
jgi:predicted dithiol-disulfide oxidoreductase (DUF899 family)